MKSCGNWAGLYFAGAAGAIFFSAFMCTSTALAVKVVATQADRIRGYEFTASNQAETYYSGFTAGGTGTDIEVGDYDADGDNDYAIVAGGRIRIYDGSVNGEGPYWESYAYEFGDMVSGDFNNDGNDDLAASASGRLRAWYSPGSKSQEAGEDWWGADYGETVKGLSAGDFDSDGSTDIAAPIGGRVRIWQPNTQAGGAWDHWAGYDYWPDLGITVAGDFLHNDGELEVAALASGRVRVWDPDTQPGGGNDSGEVWWSESTSELGASGTILAAGDFNGDGNDEIAAHYGFRIRNYEPATQAGGSAHGWYSTDSYYPSDFTAIAAGDIDGDEHLDIVASVGGRLRAWEPNGQTAAGTWDFLDQYANGDALAIAFVSPIIPEPSSALLLTMSTLAWIAIRRRL
jgi:hypothetical protein